MELCDGCEFNLYNYLAWFQNEPSKMLERHCDNETLRRRTINKSCLELFALDILMKDLHKLMNFEERNG